MAATCNFEIPTSPWPVRQLNIRATPRTVCTSRFTAEEKAAASEKMELQTKLESTERELRETQEELARTQLFATNRQHVGQPEVVSATVETGSNSATPSKGAEN